VDDLAAFFDSRARAYDRQLWLERPALRTAARLAAPAPGEHVVDIAAGTGGLAVALARREGGLGSLVLVDAAPRMLARAGPRLRGVYPRPEWCVADARDMPLPDRSADLVSIGYLLHLLEPSDAAAVVREAVRLLRPAGRLVVVVHACPPGHLGAVYRWVWALRGRLARDTVVGQGPMADLAALLERHGLDVVARRWVPGAYVSEVVVARPVSVRCEPGRRKGCLE
jgi:ubiquinone/menaquinone biosynthesis C-methylase UbiE